MALAIKHLALLLLIFQMVSVVTLLRASRRPPPNPSHPDDPSLDLYTPSTAVSLQELLKLLLCALKISHSNSFQPRSTYNAIKAALQPIEVLKLTVPSLIYLIQNNLLYLALTKLDATTYQVTYQLKIITTAVFSVAMIPGARGRMTGKRWGSLILLFFGVCLAQSSSSTGDHHSLTTSRKDKTVGLICVVTASVTSGFAGVYFEMVLKGSKTGLWERNIQLGLPSVILGFLSSFYKDGPTILASGFLHHYTPLVWSVVIVQALGGLLVAVVVKYADNIMKVFATSIAIIAGAIVNGIWGGFRPDGTFVLGAAGVCAATVIYGTGGKRVKERVEEEGLPLVGNGGERRTGETPSKANGHKRNIL